MRACAVISFVICLSALGGFAYRAADRLLAGVKTLTSIGFGLLGAAILAAILGATLLVLAYLIGLRRDLHDLTIAGRGADEYLAIRHRIQHR